MYSLHCCSQMNLTAHQFTEAIKDVISIDLYIGQVRRKVLSVCYLPAKLDQVSLFKKG